MKKVLNIILKVVKYFVLAVFILYVAVIAVQKITENSKSLGGIRIFTIVSESMVPEYNIGDIIIVKETDVNKIKVNDDLCYLGKEGDFKDKVVTHRVKEVLNNDGKVSFITEGIANVMPDPEVKSDQVYGKVVYKFYLLSLLGHYLQNKVILFLVIFVPIFGYIVLCIWRMINEKIDEETEDESE